MATWCSSCTSRKPTIRTDSGLICCTGCGKVVGEDNFSSEPTFIKDSAGQSRLAGNFVRSVYEESASRQRTLRNAEDMITQIALYLELDTGQHINEALAFYKIALDLNFTRGRSSEQVAAACLYIACREMNLPFFLIEFSEHLGVNVYELGHVYLQLLKLLHLEEHPLIKRLVDPSLFIHKLTRDLLGGRNHASLDDLSDSIREVEKTALLILTSMKRNWMQTGRKPGGICGAALYISALSHGLKFSKSDVIKVIHTCEATLSKRLIEFEDTKAGQLSIGELEADEAERRQSSRSFIIPPSDGELLCAHKDTGVPHVAHGLCRSCYDEFITISGGCDGELDPPAFQRAERERLAVACDEETMVPNKEPSQPETSAIGVEAAERIGYTSYTEETIESGDESDLADVDDPEIEANIITDKKERDLKEKFWTMMNPDYEKEQKLKDAAKVEKSKRVRKTKRCTEGKTPQTSAEAAYQMMASKKLSSKVNYDALEKLFGDPLEEDSLNPKRPKTDGPEQDETSHASEKEYDLDNLW